MTSREGRSVEAVGKLTAGSRIARLSAWIPMLTVAVSPFPGSGSHLVPVSTSSVPRSHLTRQGRKCFALVGWLI